MLEVICHKRISARTDIIAIRYRCAEVTAICRGRCPGYRRSHTQTHYKYQNLNRTKVQSLGSVAPGHCTLLFRFVAASSAKRKDDCRSDARNDALVHKPFHEDCFH